MSDTPPSDWAWPIPPTSCKFDCAHHGPCGSLFVGPDGMCEKHSKAVCVSCGAKAIGECSHASQFVCGSPLCADCTGEQTPQGYHRHARRSGRGRGLINIVFSGEEPDLVFVEVEDKVGKSVCVGRWFKEGDLSILAIDALPVSL